MQESPHGLDFSPHILQQGSHGPDPVVGSPEVVGLEDVDVVGPLVVLPDDSVVGV